MLTDLLLLKLKSPIDYAIVCLIFRQNYINSLGSDMQEINGLYYKLTQYINDYDQERINKTLERINELCK